MNTHRKPSMQASDVDAGSDILGKLTQGARDAELTLLGSFLLPENARHRPVIAATVRVSDFVGDESLGLLYGVLVDRHEAGEPADDFESLRAELQSCGLWERIGGRALLAEIIPQASASPLTVAKAVKKNAARVQCYLAMTEALKALQESPDPYEIANNTAAKLEALGSRSALQFKTSHEIALEVVADLDKPRGKPVFSGLEKLDRYTGGFCPGQLIILAARTSLGKSALAAQIAEHNARQGRPVLFVSIEMSSHELITRILARESMITTNEFTNGSIDGSRRRDVADAAETLRGVELYPQHMPGAKLREITTTAKAFKATKGLALLVVDYVQIIEKADSRTPLREHIGDCTRTLKRLGSELGCPVLLLSQFNRESTKQEAPTLANLADSTSLENDADKVLAIHRGPYDETGDLIIMKNRQGEKVTLSGLRWDGPSMQFSFAPTYAEFA